MNYVRCNGNDLNENGGERPVERKKRHGVQYRRALRTDFQIIQKRSKRRAMNEEWPIVVYDVLRRETQTKEHGTLEGAYEVIVTGTVGNYEMVGERSRGRFPHPPLRLANPFPRRPYPYSFQNNPEYCKQDMFLPSLLAVVLALAFITSSSAQDAQIVLDSIHNATSLTGTWSSGAKNVLTGAVSLLSIQPLSISPPFVSQNFANPRNMSFTYPKTTGISYSLCVFSQPLSHH